MTPVTARVATSQVVDVVTVTVIVRDSTVTGKSLAELESLSTTMTRMYSLVYSNIGFMHDLPAAMLTSTRSQAERFSIMYVSRVGVAGYLVP